MVDDLKRWLKNTLAVSTGLYQLGIEDLTLHYVSQRWNQLLSHYCPQISLPAIIEPNMSTLTPAFEHVVVAAHPHVPKADKVAVHIASALDDLGVHAATGLLYDESLRQIVANGETDLLIALGGDGTMLRAGHLCAPYNVPIFGVNLGKFGFLIEIQEDQWETALERLMNGDYWLEIRMMLNVKHCNAGETLDSWDVLNEVVVSRGEIMRPVHLDASLDGRFLSTYVADGLIASTATGSTAYALAVGGPILPPELRNILLIAVAPHLSIDRGIVLSEGSEVTMTVHTGHQAILSVDGQAPVDLSDGDCVTVRASEHSVQFVRIQDPGYFYRNLTPLMYYNPSTGNNR
jgi:NAD+ kinase